MIYPVDGFDPPVDPQHAQPDRWPVGWYDATGFALPYKRPNGKYEAHTGADLNLDTPADDTDAHQPVYAIANGVVTYAQVGPLAWGNVIVIRHEFPDGRIVYSRYAHVEAMQVWRGAVVKRGQQIARIGNAFGRQSYHLHFEIGVTSLLGTDPTNWPSATMQLDPAIAFIRANYADPLQFIQDNRQVAVTARDVVITGTLNVRVRPDKASPVLKVLRPGAKVRILPAAVNGYVALVGQPGWVIDGYWRG